MRVLEEKLGKISLSYHFYSPLVELWPQKARINYFLMFQAVAWCPWQPNVLASGGGTADRHIRFWNCSTGSCLNAVDTKSQVCRRLFHFQALRGIDTLVREAPVIKLLLSSLSLGFYSK